MTDHILVESVHMKSTVGEEESPNLTPKSSKRGKSHRVRVKRELGVGGSWREEERKGGEGVGALSFSSTDKTCPVGPVDIVGLLTGHCLGSLHVKQILFHCRFRDRIIR